MKKLSLIPDWSVAWRFWSVRLGALAIAIQTYMATYPNAALEFWQSLPPEMKAFFPTTILPRINMGLMLLALAARFVSQPKAQEINAVKQAVKDGEKAKSIEEGEPL